ncbi:MAG: DMT family transporter [Deinococcales bacterium]
MSADGPDPPQAPSGAATGYLLVLTAAVLWGLLGVFAKGILADGLGPLEISFWRATLAGGAFLVHALARGRLRLARRSDALPFLGFALIGVTLFYASLNLSIAAGGVSLAVILMYSAPAFVVVLAALLLGERLSATKVTLVVLATLGVVLVARGGGAGIDANVRSVAWGLAAGISYASYYIFGKWVLQRYAPVTIYALVLPVGALGLLPLVHFHAKRPGTWLLLLALALVSTYLAYLAYYTGLKRIEASRAVLVATLEPVVAATLAALLFDERFGPWGLVGAALILVSALLSALPALRRRPLEQRALRHRGRSMGARAPAAEPAGATGREDRAGGTPGRADRDGTPPP